MFFVRHRLANVAVDDLGAERLGDERRALGQIAGTGLGFTGGDDDRDMRKALGRPTRQRKPVQVARHVHVGEQQVDVVMVPVKDGEGVGDVHRLEYAKPCVFQDLGRSHQYHGIVVDDERAERIRSGLMRHARRFPRLDGGIRPHGSARNGIPAHYVSKRNLIRSSDMRTLTVVSALVLTALAGVGQAEAKGCLKGAVVGGLAGHMVGHGMAGAAAGCAVGHHRANRATTTDGTVPTSAGTSTTSTTTSGRSY